MVIVNCVVVSVVVDMFDVVCSGLWWKLFYVNMFVVNSMRYGISLVKNDGGVVNSNSVFSILFIRLMIMSCLSER